MKVDIIPQIRDIELKETKFSLSDFYLSESVTLAFGNAAEIFRGDGLAGEKPIRFSVSPLEPEEYRIIARADQIILAALDGVGLMYGLFTLSELARRNGGTLTEFDAFDKPAVPVRGFADDFSGGPTPTITNLFATVRRLARYKYNLYLPRLETFSAAIAPEEWQAVRAYAEGWNLRVRPSAELLGKFGGLAHEAALGPLALRAPDGRLRGCMDPRKPEVRAALGGWMAELLDRLGPGPVYGGGEGCRTLAEQLGKPEAGRLFAEHFSWVAAALKERGCPLLLGAEFYAPARGEPAVPIGRLRELPAGVEWVYADGEAREEYPALEALFRQTSSVLLAPSAHTGRRFSCDVRAAFENARRLSEAGAGRARGMLVNARTVGDGVFLREWMWPGAAAGANFAWSPDSSYEYSEFYNSFHCCFYGFSTEQAALLEQIYQYDNVLRLEAEAPLHAELFRSPFEPVRFRDREDAAVLRAALRKAAVDWSSLSPARNRSAFDVLELTVALAEFAAAKAAALPDFEPRTVEQVSDYAASALRLAGDVPALKERHRRLWFAESRLAGWPALEAAYDDLTDELRSFARNARLRRFFEL